MSVPNISCRDCYTCHLSVTPENQTAPAVEPAVQPSLIDLSFRYESSPVITNFCPKCWHASCPKTKIMSKSTIDINIGYRFVLLCIAGILAYQYLFGNNQETQQ